MYLFYAIALFVIGIDQLSKWIIIKKMSVYDQIPIIENFIYLTSHRNSGAAWGILEGQMWFFYIITIIVVIGILYYIKIYYKQSKLMALSLSFILGGAIGNFIDRIFRKEVVDFIDFILFGYDYPIFNVADSSLVVGVILLLIASILDEKKKGKFKNDNS